MIAPFVLKFCPPAKLGNVHPVDDCQKWIRFGADHRGKHPAPGVCELDREFSIGAWGTTESRVAYRDLSRLSQRPTEGDREEPKHPGSGLRAAKSRRCRLGHHHLAILQHPHPANVALTMFGVSPCSQLKITDVNLNLVFFPKGLLYLLSSRKSSASSH